MDATPRTNDRQVGKVIGVSNYRVTILLESEASSQVRAYPRHVAVITQIGGYLLFPVAPGELAVGIVVGAFEDEAIEPDVDRSMTLQLTQARRTLRTNLLGQLREGSPFEAGISVYPCLDTPTLLPTEEELKKILEFQIKESEAGKNTPLEVGVSPIYARQDVTASFNDLFARPFGIIGNTGSGKSYSVASLLQTAINTEEATAKLAQFIILDTNGEYTPCFLPRNGDQSKLARELNAVYANGKRFSLPLWTFNLNEMISFFEASQASQVPVLERVITCAREDAIDPKEGHGLRKVVGLVDSCTHYFDDLAGFADNPVGAYSGKKVLDILPHLEAAIVEIAATGKDRLTIPPALQQFAGKSGQVRAAGITDHNVPTGAVSQIQALLVEYKPHFDSIRGEAITKGGLVPITADSPVAFDSTALLQDSLFYTVTHRFRGQERIQEYIATMRLRIHRQLADKRWEVFTRASDSTLGNVIAALVGEKDCRVVVIDCSMLAHDVLPFFCAVIGRLILDLRAHGASEERTVQPYVLVLEEAHNYLRPRREDESHGLKLAREAFERIAKEGRKFGLSLIVASQRPSDVSATVLSQCANFLVHRIQNPEDIDYFKKILPTGSRDMLDQLPVLAPGDGILVGSAVNVPARVKVRRPSPQPSSDTPAPWKAWQKGEKKFDISSSLSTWVKEAGAAQMHPEKSGAVKGGAMTEGDKGKGSKKTEPNK
jgi:uncharacterized protein